MKRFALFLSLLFILALSLLPFYSLQESLKIGKLPKEIHRLHWNTNNTSRLWASHWQGLQGEVLRASYVSGQTPPDLIIVANANSWAQGLVSVSLLAKPSRAALLLMDEQNTQSIINYLHQLKPQGLKLLDDTQVLIIGKNDTLSTKLRQQGYRILSIPEKDNAILAKKVNNLRTQLAGESLEVILVDENSHYSLALPAASWVAHRGTPILYIKGSKLPEPTRQALANRKGKASIYLLAPLGVLDNSLLTELNKFGRVQQIGTGAPVQNAIEFAQFYDRQTNFGWRTTPNTNEGRKNMLLAPIADWRFAVLGAQLFSKGVFGPLLLTDRENQLPAALEKFYFSIKPDWWVTPAEGPYNHTWILGDTKQISYSVQGRVNFLQEISNYESQGNQGVSGLEALTIVWYALSVAGAVWIWFHLSTRMFQLSPFMKLAWILVVLALGPVGLWAYYTSYRGYAHQVAVGEFPRPLWVQALAATCSTMGFSIPTMISTAFLLTWLGLPLFLSQGPLFFLGSPMTQVVIWAYLAAILANAFIFVPLMLAFKENSNYRNTVRANWLTVVISMTAISLGMMTIMWWLMMEYLDMMQEESNLLWWGSMYLANLAGLATGYLGNWILVQRGEKKGTM